MTTTSKISYGTSTAITCTLASLASAALAGRSCAAIDNGTNLFDDAMLTVAVKTSSSSLANDKACYIYFYGSEDGTVFNGSSAEAEGTDVAVTIDSPTNLIGPFPMPCAASSTTYRIVIGSVANVFANALSPVASAQKSWSGSMGNNAPNFWTAPLPSSSGVVQ